MADILHGTAIANGVLWGARANDWSTVQEGQCSPVYEEVFARLGPGPGTAYLDAGCGAGRAAQLASDLGAQVSGLDASAELLAIARSRVPEGDFRQGELEQLPFADASFDLVTGFNSFQYAANPAAALAEARRVAKPGATIVVMTWGEPAHMPAAAIVAALKPLLPPPPLGAPGPFALSEEVALRNFAARAGLDTVEIFDVESPWIYPNLDTALRGLNSSGVAARAMSTSGEAAVDQAHRDALAAFRQPAGSYFIPATFRCLFARSR